ncbi:MAG: hypothetical protein BWY75_03767 [bacterium ADurb.Bin425]|nr:MAG: hypothetical protein BWY75_03767 [bacterium ADurb.Bin425]
MIVGQNFATAAVVFDHNPGAAANCLPLAL